MRKRRTKYLLKKTKSEITEPTNPPEDPQNPEVYDQPLVDVSKICESAKHNAVEAVDNILVNSYFEIGRRIVEVEQENKERAEYGQQILKRLSKDLTEKFGRGFSFTNLAYMRQFYQKYRIIHTCEELNWSHYRMLLTIDNPETRQKLEQQIIQNNWSARELKRQINSKEFDSNY